MSGVTKLGLALIIIFLLSLLGLVLELLYVLHRRHRRASVAGDPELEDGGDTGGHSGDWPLPSSPKWLLLHALCLKNQSRVEPASTAATPSISVVVKPPLPPGGEVVAEEEEEEYDIARWREMCLGPSRELYTIKEEEAEMSCAGDSADDGNEDVNGTPFTTPCASPAFYTPSSSPSRPSEAGAGKAVVESPAAEEQRYIA